MPNDEATQATDSLENEAEAAIAGATAALQDSEQVTEQEPSATDSQAEPAEEPSVDNLTTKLSAREKELEQAKKDYRELQSRTDRHESKLAERLAKLEGMVERSASQQPTKQDGPSEAEQAKAWDVYWAELAEKAEEHPKELANALKNIIPMIRDEAEKRAESRMSAKFADFDSKLQKLDPVNRANQKTIEHLMSEGLPEEYAIKAAIAVAKLNGKVRQPGDAVPPGRTADTGRKVSVQTVPQMVELNPMLEESLRLTGLDEKTIRLIRINAAKELQVQ